MTQFDFERTGSVLKPYIRLTTIQFKLVRFPDVDKKKLRDVVKEHKVASFNKF